VKRKFRNSDFEFRIEEQHLFQSKFKIEEIRNLKSKIRNQKNGGSSSPACREEKFQRIFFGVLNDISCCDDGVFC